MPAFAGMTVNIKPTERQYQAAQRSLPSCPNQAARLGALPARADALQISRRGVNIGRGGGSRDMVAVATGVSDAGLRRRGGPAAKLPGR